jgi:hypothetical protein
MTRPRVFGDRSIRVLCIVMGTSSESGSVVWILRAGHCRLQTPVAIDPFGVVDRQRRASVSSTLLQ